MKIPDIILKSVGYVAEVVCSNAPEIDIDPQGTGFFVSMFAPGTRNRYNVFVTAAHTAQGLEGRDIEFIANKKGGGVMGITMASERWFYHPSDKTVDVAVLPFNAHPDLDIAYVELDHFLTPEKMVDRKIGIGDEVFIPSLFWYAPGTERNLPILRHGNIAMLPNPSEVILTSMGYSHVYLIEARSTGGVSGAPVFVRPTIGIPANVFGRENQDLILGLSSKMYLLGLMHGHWDIRETELNNPRFMNDALRGVNLGIAMVVPAEKILETLQHPELMDLIEQNEARMRRESAPTAD